MTDRAAGSLETGTDSKTKSVTDRETDRNPDGDTVADVSHLAARSAVSDIPEPAPPARAPASLEYLEPVARTGMGITVSCTLARLAADWPPMQDIAVAGLLLFVLASLPKVSLQARVLTTLAVVLGAGVMLGLSVSWAELKPALVQGTSFATLLVALGTVRVPMRRSRLVGRAAAYLVQCSARHRYGAIIFGGHFLALIFNFGVVQIIGEMIRRTGLDIRSTRTGRDMLMAVIRGQSFATAWAPTGIAFSVISSSSKNFPVLQFMAAGLLAAMLLLAVSCALHARELARIQQSHERDGSVSEVSSIDRNLPAGDQASLWIIALMSALLLAACTSIHYAFGIPFVLATAITLPAFSLAWLYGEPGGQDDRPRQHASHDVREPGIASQYLEALTALRSETFVFVASAMIGQAIIVPMLSRASPTMAASVTSQPFLVAIATLTIIPALGLLSVASAVIVVLLAQFMLLTGIGATMPLTFALSLALGWSLAIGLAPVSATLLVAGHLSGIAPAWIGRRWNLAHVSRLWLVCAALISGAYALGI